jgi:dTDP-4-amino-4,6-dideoxygalactose transaminase
MRPRIPTADHVLPYLQGMDERRVYTNFGPLADELERRYAERLGVSADRVVACANATLGLQGAVAVSPAERFRVPAWTFPATPLAIVGADAGLSFDDVAEDDWQIQAPRPVDGEGLMPVLPFGAEPDSARWRDWDEVIIDAAASGGAVDRDLSWLPAGWAVVVSLHATKVLGAGEGGIVVFGDADRALRLREYAGFGFAERRESDIVGTNAKMSEIAAAYALAALDGWPAEEAQWRAARALAALAEHDLGIGSICSTYPGVTPYWIVDLGSADRARTARRALDVAQIANRQWWPVPCTRMGAFAPVWGGLATPVSDRLADATLGLPFYRDLSSSDVERVVEALRPVVGAR